jgi:LuxR family maltose regulon positive regulatory protein
MMAWGESDGPATTTSLGRSALVERLAHATDDGGVAVIAAEAGTGKTALLRQWLAGRVRNGVHVARTGADAGLDAELTALASGHTVVVDAADRLTDEDLAVLGAVQRDHGGTLVVAGRRDPMLPGAGLELAGEDLAWSEAEVLEVLRRWGRPMSDDEATEIAWISEGWCVAVRLAAAAGPAVLRPEAATLHHQLMREAAATIRPELLAAAVELAAVDEFDADIVDAILNPPDGGAEVIATLRRNRLFVRQAGAPGVWRFHRLFLQAARRELQSGPGARTPQRAAGDGAARRLVRVPASRSSLTDDMLDNDMLAAHAVELLLEGALEPPSRSVLMRASGGSQLGRAAIGLAALAAGDLEAAELLQGVAEAPGVAVVGELLQARHAGELAAAAAVAEQLAADADDGGLRAFAWLELGTLEFDLGHYQQAEEHLELAAGLADHAGRWGLAARAWAALALLAATAGRLRVAEQRLDMVDRTAVVPTEAAIRAAVAQAAIAFLRDDLGRASRHADVARRALATSWDPVLALYVLLAETAALEAQGADALAGARLAEGEAVRARCPAGIYQAATLDVYRVRLLDRAGRHDEAAQVLDAIAQREHPVVALAIARRGIVADDPAGALAGLRPSMHAAGRAAGRPSASHLLLYAIAVERVGDADAAHEALEQALDLAEGEGLRRAFVDEGVPVRALLEEHLKRATAHAAFISDVLDHVATRRPAPEAELRSRLTERELVVLGYLPTEMTAGDIADALTVSEATVRTHLHHIYAKLDADGRRDAVRRARDLRLLSPQ